MSIDDILGELVQAEHDLEFAQIHVNKLRSEKDRYRTKLSEKLIVGKQIPCKVARLNDGHYVVHVWVESASTPTPNQLHIVELSELD